MSGRRRMGVLIAFSGAAVAVATLARPEWRDGEGWLRAEAVVGLALGAALAGLGVGVARRAGRFAAWAGLLVVGQAVALQLVRAGNVVRYQHLPPLQALADPDLQPWLGLVAAQALVAGVALWHRRRPVAALLGGSASRAAWAGTVLVLTLGAATVSPRPSVYLGELGFAALLTAVQAATLLVALTWTPQRLLSAVRGWLEAVGEPAANRPVAAGRLAAGAAVAATLLAATLHLAAYQRHPHVPDEVAYLLHARLLSEGALTLPAPPVPEGFEVYLLEVAGGRWFPAPPPGWPAILALGVRAGVPWLVNPLLAGLAVWLAYRLLSSLYDRRVALLAAWLLALSPWHLFLGMSWMTHVAALVAALGAALCLLRNVRGGGIGWSALAGVLVGVVATIRPLDAVIVALLLTPLVLAGRGGARAAAGRLAACGVAGLLVGATLLAYNARLTGDPMRAPLQRYLDRTFAPGANDYGFGADRGMGWALDPNPGHSPFDALVNSSLNAFALNIELFGWSVGSLVFASLIAFSRRRRRADLAMLGTVAAVYVAYFFYYFSGGPDFGARYWYLMIVPLVALTARGVLAAGERLGERSAAPGPDSRPLLAAALLALAAVITFLPWRAVDKYRHYRGMRPDIRELAARHGFGRSLVLVRGESHPDYASAAVYNPLDFEADAPIYAWDRSEAVRTELLAAYRDRPVWTVDGPSRTGRGFVLAAGPVPPADRHAEGGDPRQGSP